SFSPGCTCQQGSPAGGLPHSIYLCDPDGQLPASTRLQGRHDGATVTGPDFAGFRAQFPALRQYAWLNTAGVPPGAEPVLVATLAGKSHIRPCVLVSGVEFRSNLFPWLALADRGCDVTVLEPDADGLV